jgi:hypothetical protein
MIHPKLFTGGVLVASSGLLSGISSLCVGGAHCICGLMLLGVEGTISLWKNGARWWINDLTTGKTCQRSG